MAYESHHLSLEEQWFVRERPYLPSVIAVRKIIAELDEHERAAEVLRRKLEIAVATMNDRRTEVTQEEVAQDKPKTRVRVRG